MRAADDDRLPQADELRQEVGPRPALGAVGVGRGDDDLPTLGRPGLAAEIDLDSASVSRKSVSRASQPRTSAPQAREMLA